jgi:hypothetical protein
MTCGDLSSRVINAGTYGLTAGACSLTSLTSTGTMSCGTYSMTCGDLSSRVINAGTYSLTAGASNFTSVTSTGGIQQYYAIFNETEAGIGRAIFANGYFHRPFAVMAFILIKQKFSG